MSRDEAVLGISVDLLKGAYVLVPGMGTGRIENFHWHSGIALVVFDGGGVAVVPIADLKLLE